MHQKSQMLSVINIAEICGVARSTASYWITDKALPAHRSGNKYMVTIEDLVIFLESIGRPVPRILLENVGGIFSHPFKPFQTCWDYWKIDSHGEECEGCAVFQHQINECFTAKNNHAQRCSIECSECRYLYEHYIPYMSFIHRMAIPAAIFKELYIWSGNNAWADLCGVDIEKLIGIGVEEVIHPDSIKTIINYNKKIQQGDTSCVLKSPIYFENHNGEKIEAYLSISPLKQPAGTCLATAENAFYSDS